MTAREVDSGVDGARTREEVVPVPLPSAEETDVVPPGRGELRLICGGVHTNAAPDSGWTELQHVLMSAMCEALGGIELDPAWYDDVVTPMDLARGLARRDEFVRSRILQQVVLAALVLNPTPPEVVERIGQVATALGVGEHFLGDVEKFGPESYDAAIIDFARNGYAGDFSTRHRPVLRTDRDIGDGWGVVNDDPRPAAQWAALGGVPPARSAATSGSSTRAGASRSRARPAPPLRCWRSTTGSMSSPTTGPPWRTSSRPSASSPGPTTTLAASASW